MRKATVKIRRKPSLHQTDKVQNLPPPTKKKRTGGHFDVYRVALLIKRARIITNIYLGTDLLRWQHLNYRVALKLVKGGIIK